MRRIISAVTAAIFTAAMITAQLGKVSASSIYNDEPDADGEYCCIVALEGDPLAKNDQAKEKGVDSFILTDEGKAAYIELIAGHTQAMETLFVVLGREVTRLYDYTAVYNGIAVILRDSEYRMLAENRKDLGFKAVYRTSACTDEIKQSAYAGSTTYTDITDKALESAGVTKVPYKGDSTVIAVIDNEFDTAHEFISTLPEGVKGRLTPEFIGEVSPFLSASDKEPDYYLNEKIPFRFNYDGRNTDTAIKNKDSAHGTHVAGIAAGNGAAETDSRFDAKGAAPDAQLLLMATKSLNVCSIVAAYDDCAYLGADTVNVSFGTDIMPVGDAPYESEAISNLAATGTVFCAAAGNSSKVSFPGIESMLNTDYATTGNPGGCGSALTVGSADNSIYMSYTITADGQKFLIAQSENPINRAFGGKKADIAIVPGYGAPEDFLNVDVRGKIAVINRGEIRFEEKAANAKKNGAVGVIFVNNNDDSLITPDCTELPGGMISRSGGEKLSELTEVSFSKEPELFRAKDNFISGYSSWGFTEELLLKPDITAVGGNIISSLPGNSYGIKSGTSMAAPQLSGITALVREHINNNRERYGVERESEVPELIARLLMSTATPIMNSEESGLSSPRLQGSGLVRVDKAISTPAYLYTESEKDNFRPKLSLGDNFEKNAESLEFSNSTFKFHIKNVSDSPVTYKLSADLMSDEAAKDGLGADVTALKKSKVEFKSAIYNISSITVAPGEDAVVNLDIKFDIEDINFLNANFPNGTFIDGFVHLKSSSAPELCLPFSGYLGSWNDGGIFEPFIYDENKKPSKGYSYMCDRSLNIAGQNFIAKNYHGNTVSYLPTYSPNGDNILDNIALYIGFRRRCRNVTAEIYKGPTKVYNEKFTLDYGYGTADSPNRLYSLNWNFKGATDGDIYTLRLTAQVPYTDGSVRKEIMSQEFKIDLTPPKLESCRKLILNEGGVKAECLLVRMSDNYEIQGGVIADKGSEVISSGYVSAANTKESYVIMPVPESSSGAVCEFYDTAGNWETRSLDEMMYEAGETYTLTCDENLYFSTNDKSFGRKIKLTDSKGSEVRYSFSMTPEMAYKRKAKEFSMFVDSLTLMSFPAIIGLAGDTDLNEVTDLHDVITIAKYILWKSNPRGPLKDEFQGFEGSFGAYLADFDVNGKIDLHDAVGISKLLLSNKK